MSMSRENGGQDLDVAALQHYQQTIPSLKASLHSEADLASNGVFLTHFVLLLYEIAASEPREYSLWSEHMSQLLKIVLLRRKIFTEEPFEFLIWWIATIDIHGVLAGIGSGKFVETAIQQNLLSSHTDLIHYASRSKQGPAHDGPFPSPLAFHRRLCILAAEIGLLGRDLRAEAPANPQYHKTQNIHRRQQRIGVLQDTLRQTWQMQHASSIMEDYNNSCVPVAQRGIFEHVRARIICSSCIVSFQIAIVLT